MPNSAWLLGGAADRHVLWKSRVGRTGLGWVTRWRRLCSHPLREWLSGAHGLLTWVDCFRGNARKASDPLWLGHPAEPPLLSTPGVAFRAGSSEHLRVLLRARRPRRDCAADRLCTSRNGRLRTSNGWACPAGCRAAPAGAATPPRGLNLRRRTRRRLTRTSRSSEHLRVFLRARRPRRGGAADRLRTSRNGRLPTSNGCACPAGCRAAPGGAATPP